MSPTRRPSSVTGLRGATAPRAEVPASHSAKDASFHDLPPRPEKPVRFTLDLDRPHHQFLKHYAVQIEADGAQVLRALLDELRDDPDLATRVQARIWQARQR